MHIPLGYYLLVCVVILARTALSEYVQCAWKPRGIKKSDPKCDKDEVEYKEDGLRYLLGEHYLNIPVFSGAYCFNNGTGLCKAFSGRFEFYFNTFEDKFIGPVESSKYVDSNGYHERVPVSYSIDGSIVYIDRSINWSRKYVKKLSEKKNLLNANHFNWCSFNEKNFWPYKSSFADLKTNGTFHVYFYNRQTCIYNTMEKKHQHFNTRFKQKTGLRVDLDMNPTIFVMEDQINNDLRLVKHKRQHWFEVTYKILENPIEGVRYFIEMGTVPTYPSRINENSGPLLSRNAYPSDLCLKDDATYYEMIDGKPNPIPVQYGCGQDAVEAADVPMVAFRKGVRSYYEVGLHNIARDYISDSFFGTDVGRNERNWRKFAKNGLTFTAFTTIPDPGNSDRVKVVMLFSDFRDDVRQNDYDQYYPVPYMSVYTAFYEGKEYGELIWSIEQRDQKKRKLINLNYVDDIAYLHYCNTILVIFGPLYSEIPVDQIENLDYRSTIGSIYDLGIFELATAFFAHPGKPILYVFHRTNYIQAVHYTCGSNGSLVTAVKEPNEYMSGQGPTQMEFLRSVLESGRSYHEEDFFKDVGVFKGEINKPEAPDPDLYPLEEDDEVEPLKAQSLTFIYILIGVVTAIVIALCIICMLTLRRRKKHRRAIKTVRSSNMSSSAAGTQRSGGLKSSSISASKTRRSGPGKLGSSFRSGRPAASSLKTGRSGLSSASSKSNRGGSSKTGRSSRLSSADPSGKTSATHRSQSLAKISKAQSQASGVKVAPSMTRRSQASASSRNK